MNFETLKESGLLEQYVLGLTSRQEAEMIERVAAEDPRAQAELDRLREEMDAFVEGYGMEAPDDGRPARQLTDFERLDHEMIFEITASNRRLTVWRYALGALSLLLVCLCGYLFRLHLTSQAGFATERARRAQDLKSHGLAIEKLADNTVDWSEMVTLRLPAAQGELLLHYLSPQRLLLLDLSHVDTLTAREAFFVFYGRRTSKRAVFQVPAAEQWDLHPLPLGKPSDLLRIYRAPVGSRPARIVREFEPVAQTVLAETLTAAD